MDTHKAQSFGLRLTAIGSLATVAGPILALIYTTRVDPTATTGARPLYTAAIIAAAGIFAGGATMWSGYVLQLLAHQARHQHPPGPTISRPHADSALYHSGISIGPGSRSHHRHGGSSPRDSS
jgi:hypothetical protein